MKLFRTAEIRAWDQYTILHEPIASIDLMERASVAFTDWYCHYFPDKNQVISIYCGIGNNGGDGLAIARLLRNRFYDVNVIICGNAEKGSEDFTINLQRLSRLGDVTISFINPEQEIPELQHSDVIIDALFGTGITRPLSGGYASLVDCINALNAIHIAVDIPSGMPAEGVCNGPCIKAQHTCSFQIAKLSFFRAENYLYTGQCHILDIGLLPEFSMNTASDYYLIDRNEIIGKIRKRNTFDHKGTYGHCMVIAGSKGKAGAAILAASASLRSGAGLVTVLCPENATTPLQTAIPEVMVQTAGKDHIVNMNIWDMPYNAIAAGPGIGTAPETVHALEALLLTSSIPAVLDADVLNIIAGHKKMLRLLRAGTIITPHPKEFDRLFGEAADSEHRLSIQKEKAVELNIIIILKGAYTSVAFPDGTVYFNTTGNPGMATAGSGDVLTGIIGGLLAQRYTPEDAALVGVYLHGLAGDLALTHQSMESMIASDIVRNLGNAFKHILNIRPSLFDE